MKSRALRAVLVILALAAVAGAGYQVWVVEQRVSGARSDAADFDRNARLAVLGFTQIRGAQQAYVAEGQPSDSWLIRVDDLVQDTAPRLTELRLAAKSAEAQGGLEASIESFAAFGNADAKARGYLKSDQRLSASDVIFADGASALMKVINAVDTARAQESVAREIAIAPLRQLQLYYLGAQVLSVLLVLLLLAPLPRAVLAGAGEPADGADAASASGGLGLSQMAPDRPANAASPTPGVDGVRAMGFGPDQLTAETPGPDLPAVAEICSAFAKVEDPRELRGLLERTAKALNATGVIVWMPDGAQGSLRPVLAYGYPPLSLTRMGAIDPAADNATAVAFRTGLPQTVSTEPASAGAVVAPLVTSDGCSGAMAVELKEGVRTTTQLQAVATIVAAQLATLITPSAQTPAPAESPAEERPPETV